MAEPDACAICLEPMGPNENQDHAHDTTLLTCRHRFHTKCIIDWVQKQRTDASNKCPTCRKPMYEMDQEVVVISDSENENEQDSAKASSPK